MHNTESLGGTGLCSFAVSDGAWMVLLAVIWLRPATGMTPQTAISEVLFGAFPQLETQQEAERLESSGHASLKFVTNHLEARDGWLIYSAKHIILFLML